MDCEILHFQHPVEFKYEHSKSQSCFMKVYVEDLLREVDDLSWCVRFLEIRLQT